MPAGHLLPTDIGMAEMVNNREFTTRDKFALRPYEDILCENATAEFRAPNLGQYASYIQGGPQGNWFIRSADPQGRVVLQDIGGNVGIGTYAPQRKLHVNSKVSVVGIFETDQNDTRLIFRMKDDKETWLSASSGRLCVTSGAQNQPATIEAIFATASSIEFKRDVERLADIDLDKLFTDTISTELVRYRYQAEASRIRVGVIAEWCPSYLREHEGRHVSISDYISMLHGAIKVLAKRVEQLEAGSGS